MFSLKDSAVPRQTWAPRTSISLPRRCLAVYEDLWYAVPDMNVVDLAAWIIIGAALGKLLTIWGQRQRRFEDVAATYEYNDPATSERRRQELLIRYPQTLIPGPGAEYREKAYRNSKSEREDRKTNRPSVADFIVALVLCAVLCCIAFLCFAGFIGRFHPPVSGTPIETAQTLSTAYLGDHIYTAVIIAGFGWYSTAWVVKLIHDEWKTL